MLFAHGARFGGHTLYVKDNRLHYVYSFVGIFEQKIVTTEVCVGRDSGAAVADDYPWERPYRFTGGVIKRSRST